MKYRALIASVVGLLLLIAPAIADEGKKEVAPKAVKAIDWNKLAEFLPAKVEGMKVGDLDGGTMTMADPTNPSAMFSYSTVERTYKGKGKEITLRILDTGLNQLLMASYMMAFEYDSPEGSMKTIDFAGHKAKMILEKERGKVTETQIMFLVSGRLLFAAEGEEGVTKEDIEALVTGIDFAKMGKLVKNGKPLE